MKQVQVTMSDSMREMISHLARVRRCSSAHVIRSIMMKYANELHAELSNSESKKDSIDIVLKSLE